VALLRQGIDLRKGKEMGVIQGWYERLLPRLREQILYAYQRAPAVRRKMDAAGMAPHQVETVADLQRIPITHKEELAQLQREDPPFGGFLAVDAGELTHIFVSPGPIYDPGGSESFYTGDWARELLCSFGLGRGDLALNTYSYHMVPAGMGLDEFLCSAGLTVVPGGVGNTDVQVQVLRDLGIALYCGTPSFLMAILRRAEEMGLDPRRDLRLRAALLGAEMLPPSLRRELQERGITPIETYGTADLGLIAMECPAHQGLHLSEEMVIEVVDPATGRQLPPGETGEVVATTFNKVYPLIRFGTGDATYLIDEPCPCGRPSPRIPRILGRVGEAVKVRGMFLHPHQVREALEGLEGVARFQAAVGRKEHRDELVLRLELTPGAPPPDVEKLQARLQSAWRVRVDRVELLPPGSLPQDAKALVDERSWE
jgi:phenylacetate-CoA ligase